MTRQVQYFILLKDSEALEHKYKVAIGKHESKIEVLAGSLWFCEKDIEIKNNFLKIRSAEQDVNLFMQIQREYLGILSTIQFKLLLALTTCNDRLSVYKDKSNKLRITQYIREVSKKNHSLYIQVTLNENSLTSLNGQLKFIGHIPKRPGLWLGINLDKPYTGTQFDTKSVYYNDKLLFPSVQYHAVLANVAQISYPKYLEQNILDIMKQTLSTDSPMYSNDLDTNIYENSSEYVDKILKTQQIIDKAYILNRFSRDIEDLSLVEDVILDRNCYTVPPIKMAAQLGNIRDESFWTFHEKDFCKVEESKFLPNATSIKNKRSSVPKCNSNDYCIESASNDDLKDLNLSSDLISRGCENERSKFPIHFEKGKVEKIEKKKNSSDKSFRNSSVGSTPDNTIIGEPCLEVGERVIWFTDSGLPEFATVKWIGILDKFQTQYTVGVEFDNPIGTGTGRYKNKNLFFCSK